MQTCSIAGAAAEPAWVLFNWIRSDPFNLTPKGAQVADLYTVNGNLQVVMITARAEHYHSVHHMSKIQRPDKGSQRAAFTVPGRTDQMLCQVGNSTWL